MGTGKGEMRYRSCILRYTKHILRRSMHVASEEEYLEFSYARILLLLLLLYSVPAP